MGIIPKNTLMHKGRGWTLDLAVSEAQPPTLNKGHPDMLVTDAQLSRLITSTDDLKAASLSTKILLNRLRVHARSQPATLANQIAELRSYVAKNPDAGRELALT
jgi:hypothetical protein